MGPPLPFRAHPARFPKHHVPLKELAFRGMPEELRPLLKNLPPQTPSALVQEVNHALRSQKPSGPRFFGQKQVLFRFGLLVRNTSSKHTATSFCV